MGRRNCEKDGEWMKMSREKEKRRETYINMQNSFLTLLIFKLHSSNLLSLSCICMCMSADWWSCDSSSRRLSPRLLNSAEER